MGGKVTAFAVLVLFALFCGAITAMLTWLSGARPATAAIAGGSTFGGTIVVGLATLNFFFGW
jgi:hypothetical protein